MANFLKRTANASFAPRLLSMGPSMSLVPNRERRGGMKSQLLEKSPSRVAFDWATRRKPLAGRTLWMLEPSLVRREGRVDPKEKPEGGRLRIGECSLMRLYSGPNGSSMPGFAGEAHDSVGVQLHVGAPTWSAD
jgi:hypothetical protein